MEAIAEEWRPVKGWPYEVSSLGRVRRIVPSSRHGEYLHATKTTLYPMINFSKKIGPVCVHVLVAEAFIGPRPPGKVVNHIDGNTRNNAKENLEYLTHGENIHYAYKMGFKKALCGEQIGRSKLTEEKVRNIRVQKSEGKTLEHLSLKFGVSERMIWDIVHFNYWRHVI